MRRATRTLTTAAAAAAVLALTGCGLLPGGDEIDEVIESVIEGEGDEQPAPDADDDGPADAAPADPAPGNGDLALPVTAQQIGVTVQHGLLEYTIDSMDVVDLDAEAGRDERWEGAKVVFSGTATNPGAESLTPRTRVTVEWQEGATGHSFDTMGTMNAATIPGGAAGPVELEATLSPDLLDSFDQDGATLVLGHAGQSPARIPLGSVGELVDRIPVPQPDLVGKAFDIGGAVTVTVDEADLRWSQADSHVEDGTGLLELVVTLQNGDSGHQVCWNRGTGNTFGLVAADGTGTADLSMSDRGCTAEGASTVSVTGIPVHEDYAGEYTLTLDLSVGADNLSDSVTFTMSDGPGVLLSER